MLCCFKFTEERKGVRCTHITGVYVRCYQPESCLPQFWIRMEPYNDNVSP
jgi:hypothetical protein